MNSVACANSYWTGLAQCYTLLGPPLRPSNEDVRVVEQAVASEPAGCRALLLGVTPGIVRMRWPDRCSLIAVDASWPMVQALRPHGCPAICADWLSLPLPSGSFDLVVGDGSLISLSYPLGLQAIATALLSVLKPDGSLIVRCYFQPPRQEQPEEVFEDLRRAAIPSFHHFKLRLLMSMQRSPQRGVAVSDVYQRWKRERIDRAHLPDGPGWEMPVVETIEYYRDTDTVYWFPTLTEFRDVMLERFAEISLTVPPGTLAERCPVLVLKPR